MVQQEKKANKKGNKSDNKAHIWEKEWQENPPGEELLCTTALRSLVQKHLQIQQE